MKLNLGCGSQVVDGWINVDYAIGARFAKIPLFRELNRKLRFLDTDWSEKIYLHDVSRRLPFEDSSVDVIYTSHTLEHFSKEDGLRLLSECHRVLRNNGKIRIIVPDLRRFVDEYVEGRMQADDFVEKLGVLYGNSKNIVKKRLAPLIEFPHRCMYDNPRLLSILREIGFDAANRAPFDSDIDDIRRVELEARTQNAVIVEGAKR